MSPFKFYKLPYLAQYLVVQLMTPAEVFYLTSLSVPIKNMTKRMRWCEQSPRVYFSHCFPFDSDEFYWKVSVGNKKMPVLAYQVISNEVEHPKQEEMKLYYKPSASPEFPFYYMCKSSDVDKFWEKVQKTLEELFQTNKIEVSGSLTEISKSITFADYRLECFRPEAKNLEKFLESLDGKKSPNSIVMRRIYGSLRENSRISKIDYVFLRDDGYCSSDFFGNFCGKNLFMVRLRGGNQAFVRLIKKWLDGERNYLESVIISHGSRFASEEVLKEFHWLPYSEERRAKVFIPSVESNFEIPPETYDHSDGVDIIRESDGLLASIKISGTEFTFFVWKNRFP
ncbi:hypothetical protein CRE_27802 [Caenorhabditis remanei]|uniref:F-box domain-containing protein n=1 Tax=Caenorhabditis remanei TaxID=31234 RepID=E3N5K1_CAERE|nr:hypothetical protein CRE_27802 [Caenorhabditis remanei]